MLQKVEFIKIGHKMENEILVNKLTTYRIKPEFIGRELSARASRLEKISENVVIYCDISIPRRPKYLKKFFQNRSRI